MKLDRTNVISILIKTFHNVGIEISSIINPENVSAVLVKKLAVSNIMQQNKSKGSRGKASHIALTTDERLLFYSEEELDKAKKDDKDTFYTRMKCYVSSEDVSCLTGGRRATPCSLDLTETYTHKKIGLRKNENPQVQISKIKEDDRNFILLRKALYEGDILVVIKFKDDEKLLFLGLKSEWLSPEVELPRGIIVNPVDVADAINLELEDDLIMEEAEDAAFQGVVNSELSEMESYEFDEDDDYPEASPGTEGNRKSSRGKASPRKTAEVIAASGFKCFFEGDGNEHFSFKKDDGLMYYEGHHLIPMSYQKDYPLKLDKKPNIVCLCVVCHSKIHHADSATKKQMIETILEDRSDKLSTSGIIVPKETIFSLYNIKID